MLWSCNRGNRITTHTCTGLSHAQRLKQQSSIDHVHVHQFNLLCNYQKLICPLNPQEPEAVWCRQIKTFTSVYNQHSKFSYRKKIENFCLKILCINLSTDTMLTCLNAMASISHILKFNAATIQVYYIEVPSMWLHTIQYISIKLKTGRGGSRIFWKGVRKCKERDLECSPRSNFLIKSEYLTRRCQKK